MRTLAALALAALCGSCAQYEVVRFQPKPQQEALVRDGQAALISRRKNSLVLIRPAARQFQSGSRPVFVVGVYNLTPKPLEFRVANVAAVQTVNGQPSVMRVVTYEDLVTEERNRQVVAAFGAALGAIGNSMSAAQAGYSSSEGTITSSRGNTYNVSMTTYNPGVAAAAQAQASMQNEAMISATIERGQQNLANLERGVIKDNTMLPGEWYGGQLHLAPPASVSGGAAKNYSIAMMVGAERHDIEILQENVK